MGLPRFGHEIHAFNFYLASRHITTNPLVIKHGNGKSSAGDFPASHVWLIDRHVCNYQPYFGMIIQTTKQYICTRPCHPPLPHPMGWVPYTAPIWDLPPPPLWCGAPLWCGGGVVLSPSPPVVWWGCGMVCWVCMMCMVGLVCLVCMQVMVCMAWLVGIVWMVGMVCKCVGYGMLDMTVCMACMVCMVAMMGMEWFLCKVGMVFMACMFGIVCMVGVVIMFQMYGMYDRYDRYAMYGCYDGYGMFPM